MKHVSFGSTLKEARISKGLDLNTVSTRLRIRPDILQAIEEADFEHIPPRGYARNMINAYAHFLGLDSNDITRRYLDEAYSYSVKVEHSHMTDQNHQRSAARTSYASMGATSSFDRLENGRPSRESRKQAQVNSLGRVTYSLEAEDKISGGVNRTAASRMNHEAAAQARPHRAQRSTAVNGRYLNAVEGRSSAPSFDIKPYVPYLLGAAIVIVVLFIVLNLTVCHQSEPEETIPVTSESVSTDSSTASSDTSTSSSDGSTDTTSAQTVTETAPTEFTLSYEVASGKSSYIEIYVDDKIVVSDDISGSKTDSYTSSGKIRFVCDNISAVTLKIDDEEQKLKENSNGMYDTTFKFSSILKTWKKNHSSSSSTSSTSSTSSKSDTSSSSTSGSTTTGNSSSSSTESDSDSTTSSSSTSESSSSSNSSSGSSDVLSVTGGIDSSSSS